MPFCWIIRFFIISFFCIGLQFSSNAQYTIHTHKLYLKKSIAFKLAKDSATITIHNFNDYQTSVYVRIGTINLAKYHSIDVFRNLPGLNYSITLSSKTGSFKNGPLIPLSDRVEHPYLNTFKLEIPPKSSLNYKLRIDNKSLKEIDGEIIFLSADAWQTLKSGEEQNTQVSLYFSLLFLGNLIIMILFSTLIFLENKVKDFLYYACYLIFVLVFSIIADFPIKYHNLFIWQYPEIAINSKETLVYGYLIFYHLFLMQFLSLKEHLRKIYHGLKLLNYIFIVFMAVNILTLFFSDLPLQNTLYKFNTIILFAVIPYYGFVIYKLFKNRHIKFYKYILWGILFFYLGNIAGTLNQIFEWNFGGLFPNNYTQLGTFLELCFFSLGLGGKMIDESREKLRFQKKVLEVQMMALQTQMNPHFTFNCLNAIRNLVMQQQTEMASSYLLKFSKLLRLTLENSIHKEVSLADKMEYLNMYLNMEQLRFGDSLQFNITKDLLNDAETIFLPPMLVQPFVENAIKHAFIHQAIVKEIKISFKETEKDLSVTIEDNGIGILHHQNQQKNHVSRATEITKNYLQQWNALYQQQIHLEIIDKSYLNSVEKGTLVVIKIIKD